MIDFDTAFERLLGHEGKYVNDPEDPGGETNWGISKRSYPYVDIKNLTHEGAKEIYRRDFWTVLGEEVHPALKFQVFDFAVNSGISTALRKLQLAVRVADDGHWGPRSRAALAAMELNDVLMRFAAYRLKFMNKLRNWDHNSRGWTERVANQLLFAAEDN